MSHADDGPSLAELLGLKGGTVANGAPDDPPDEELRALLAEMDRQGVVIDDLIEQWKAVNGT